VTCSKTKRVVAAPLQREKAWPFRWEDEARGSAHTAEIDHPLAINPYQHAEEIDQDDFEAPVRPSSRMVSGRARQPCAGERAISFITSGGHQRRDGARVAG